jgi:hypothetical protein
MGSAVAGVLVLASIVFCVSATAKLRSQAAYRQFRTAIADTGLLPRSLRPQITAALAAAEAVTAAGLVTAAAMMYAAVPGAVRAAQAAIIGAVLLTTALSAGVAAVIHRGVLAPCACFGASSEQPLGTSHLIRNSSLLALLLAGLAGSLFAGPATQVPAAATDAFAGSVIALLLIRWEDLASLLTPVTRVR